MKGLLLFLIFFLMFGWLGVAIAGLSITYIVFNYWTFLLLVVVLITVVKWCQILNRRV